jgi:hypothetical protein
MEAEIIADYDAVNHPDSYNIAPGGQGGAVLVTKEQLAEHGLKTKKRWQSLTDDKKAEHIDIIKNGWASKNIDDRKIISNKITSTRKSNSNIWHSEGTKEKIAAGNTGNHHSDKTKLQMSASKTGKSQDVVKCPHCDKIGGLNAMNRWHFNNCRNL